MKLHLDQFDGLNAFSGYGPGYVRVNGQRHASSLVVFPDRIIESWPVRRLEDLVEPALDFLAGLPLEIVLVGTGARMQMLHPKHYRSLSVSRIGVEVMDTQAACRTYNILLAEGRKIAAALVVESPG
ncbi:MAG: Mth938-like domain-containing protein [Betaproteobacteria bacterium]